MVKLNIIIEGGVCTNNVSAETANNAESLRQSLHKFFTRVLSQDDVDVTIYMGAGNRNAAKEFARSTELHYLFVDSDLPPTKITDWFNTLINDTNPEKSIIIPQEKITDVFFMIQEMEAWFLKQIDNCLNNWAKLEGYALKDSSNSKLSKHSVIRNRDIESIQKPSDKLNTIMKAFFHKRGKSAQYYKLRTAPLLLDLLNVETLVSQDAELQRFVSTIKSKH